MNSTERGPGPIHWRLDWEIDVEPLVAEVLAFGTDDWQPHFNAGYHDGGWSGLALLSPSGSAQQLYSGHEGTGPGVPTPALERAPGFADLLSRIPLRIQSARLLRLAPGARIREHADDGIGLDQGTARLHIPVLSPPGVEFYVHGVRVPMAAGECWYLDLGLRHRVQNLGDSDRVHLVLDCDVDDTLLSLLPDVEQARGQLQARLAEAGPGAEGGQVRCERFLAELVGAPSWPPGWAAIEDSSDLLPRVVAAAAAQGVVFTEEDARGVFRERRRRWIEGRMVGVPRPTAHVLPLTAAAPEALRLPGWTPILLDTDGTEPVVELALTGDRPFKEGFFEDSIQQVLQRPAVALLRQRVSLPVLSQALAREPGLPLGGLIFHMSRCGSTLLSQLLAVSDRMRVLSEPAPLDAVLRHTAGQPEVTRQQALRTLLGALAQPGRPSEERCYIKLDCWQCLDAQTVQATLPDVPWVFVMRDPVEVIVSHMRAPGAHMVPGLVATLPPGLDLAQAVQMPREEFCARALGAYCEAMLAQWERQPGRGLLLDYGRLSTDLSDRCWPHLGVPELTQEPGYEAALQRDSKRPGFAYQADSLAKQREADERVREAAERWVMPVYRALRRHAGLDGGTAASAAGR